MSKYNDYLTEIVYQIDDIIYDFYRKSNELIAKKRNAEALIDFRDNTISTVNDMNVKALELIASFKKDNLVEERAEILLERNREILDSSYQVLLSAPNKGEFFEEMKEAAKDAIDYTSKAVNDFQASETYANIKEATGKGYTRLKDAVVKVSQDERVKEGFDTVKSKSAEAFHKGETVLKKWWHEVKEDSEEFSDDLKEKYSDFKDEVEDEYQDIKEDIKDKYHEVEEAIDETKDEYKENLEKVEEAIAETKNDFIDDLEKSTQDQLEKETEEIKEAIAGLKNDKGESE